MAKLYYRYGAMSSAKTLNLLATAHSYEIQEKKVLVMTPKLDNRFGEGKVKSRAGLDRAADVLLTPDSTFSSELLEGVSCVLVDECQFLDPRVIERLRDVAVYCSVPVICYGLRTDFRSRLFPASQRLMEIADNIEEVKTTCSFCNRKATMNLKSVNGAATMEGPTVCLGAEEMYAPACYAHFCERISMASGGKQVDFPEAWAAGDKADAQQRAQEEQPAINNAKLREASPEGRIKVCSPVAEPEKERSPHKQGRS